MKYISYLMAMLTCTALLAQETGPRNRLYGSVITKFSVLNESTRTVKLDSGALANQKITIVNTNNKAAMETYTDRHGEFMFDYVKPGDYLLYVNDGKDTRLKPIQVTVYQSKRGVNRIKPILLDRVSQTVRVQRMVK